MMIYLYSLSIALQRKIELHGMDIDRWANEWRAQFVRWRFQPDETFDTEKNSII